MLISDKQGILGDIYHYTNVQDHIENKMMKLTLVRRWKRQYVSYDT